MNLGCLNVHSVEVEILWSYLYLGCSSMCVYDKGSTLRVLLGIDSFNETAAWSPLALLSLTDNYRRPNSPQSPTQIAIDGGTYQKLFY